MPIQTRKRKQPVKEASPEKQSAPAKKSTPAISASKQPKSAPNSLAAKQPRAPANKKAKTTAKSSGSSSDFKPNYNNVIAEIKQVGPNVIQSKHLQRRKPSAAGLQDPKRAVQRQAVVKEIRRLSASGKMLKPTVIKARAKAETQRKTAGQSIVKKKVLEELKGLGQTGVHDFLSTKRASPARGRIGSTGSIGKHVFRGKLLNSVDPKILTVKALGELRQVVTPTSANRPSSVKGKIELKKQQKRVQAELLKHAAVKQIKQLGDKVGKSLLKTKQK